MNLTVEISMYPLQENFRDLIHDFIERLNEVQDLRVDTTATSTIILGEYRHVMNTLTDLMEWSADTHGKSVFVTKFIPDYTP